MTTSQMVKKYEVALILSRKSVCIHVNNVTGISVSTLGKATAFLNMRSLTALLYWLRVNGIPQKKSIMHESLFLRIGSVIVEYNILR